ncbi:MAG TPA: thioester reductase domain-containing protein [Longimicrobium sp.]|nr:thioester reductase domain-containing protein [Longimicrobium sp.]
MSEESFDGVEPVAVVGLAGRLPGAPTVEAFWANQRDGIESVAVMSEAELREAGVDPALLADPDYVRASGVIEDADRFDAAFFGYSPREAETMDPQQRLFLEVCWEAMEDAGHDPAAFAGAAGVFGGVFMNKYLAANLLTNEAFLRSPAAAFARNFNDKDFLATRVAWLLDLRGPAVTVQTACSTSLVATHLAVQSLLSYDCDLALVGGVALNVPLKSGYPVMEGGLFAPGGHCRPFDARAEGTVPGYGAAVAVLRRLSDAVADRDHVRALIRGTAVNNDGALKAGFTAPSVDAQARVIASAQAVAGVHPDTIGYLEAHGTATPVGDPIEVAALTQAFRARTRRRGFCALGSVKTNIGHLDAAAGIAGMMRAVLALEHRTIPPAANYASPNPRLELEASPFYVPTAAREWPAGREPRRAGVSSFGVGGTNAHAVLEEAPEPEPRAGQARPWQLLVLSARSRAALGQAADRLAWHLEAHPALHLADVAFTLQAGRRAFEHRRSVVARTAAEAVEALRGPEPRRAGATASGRREPVFMFPGGGTQHPDMGIEIYRSEALFRDEVDRCAELLLPKLGFDLRRFLYPSLMGGAPVDREHVPAVLASIFVTEYALAKLWMSWGVKPHAMIGHSLGEYAAACLAGVFSLEDALDLVMLRGTLFARMPEGRMLSVHLPEAEVRAMLDDRLSVAAVNAPGLTLVSGPEAEIEALAARLEAAEVECGRVRIQVASHSWMVEPFLDQFTRDIARYRLNPPTIPFLSGVTGTWIRPEEATDPAYWARHLRQPIRFADGVREAVSAPGRILLEVGPGNALATLAAAQQLVPAPVAVASMRHPREEAPDLAFLLGAVGRLWQEGVTIDWDALHGEARPRRVPLPTYPWEKKRYWIPPGRAASPAARDDSPLRLATWKRTLPPAPPASRPGPWLVLDDGSALGDRIASRAVSLGRAVIRVRRGSELRLPADGEAAVDPARPEHWEALLGALGGEDQPKPVAIHLWARGEDDAGAGSGFHGLLPLARAGASAHEGLRILAVTDRAASAGSGDEVDPRRAAMAGACRAASRERGVECRCVDVGGGGADEALAGRITAEAGLESGPALVAWRGRTRWERVYEPVAVDASPPSADGVWLFAGGLGGGSAALAGALAAAGARVVALEPPSFPDRRDWDGWVEARGEDDPTSREIRRLVRLGDDVAVQPVDAEDVELAAKFVSLRLGAVRGVVAGSPVDADDSAACRLTRAERAVALAAALADASGAEVCILPIASEVLLGNGGADDPAAAYLAASAEARDGGAEWIAAGLPAGEDVETREAAEKAVARLLPLLLSGRLGGQLAVAAGELPSRPITESEEKAAPRPADDGYVPPRSEAERKLAAVWSELLGVERVGMEDDFFELGGHSLMLAQMTRRLRGVFPAKLTVRDLFEASTIASLAALIEVREGAGAGAAASGPDLAAEVALDPAITAEGLAPAAAGPPRAVFLTGATGFLGAFLCAELLRATDAEVHCLVRAGSVEEGEERVRRKLESFGLLGPEAGRIRAVPGDLARPLLGLSKAEFDALAERVDAVYHCGAWVNFARPYRVLKASNVAGTQEVLRLAATARLKPVHHVSTMAVLAGAFVSGVPAVDEDTPLPPPVGHDTGYSQSKWVAEGVVNLARERGIPISVYRPGVILGDSRTGVSNQEDYVTRVIQGCVQLGLAPLREYPLATATADYVAGAIVALSLRQGELGKTFHTIEPDPLPWNRIFDHLRAFGYPVRSIPYGAWRDALTARIEEGAEGESVLEPLLGILSDTADRPMPRIGCGNVLRGLAGSRVVRPGLDAHVFATFFRWFVRSGLLPPVPAGARAVAGAA